MFIAAKKKEMECCGKEKLVLWDRKIIPLIEKMLASKEMPAKILLLARKKTETRGIGIAWMGRDGWMGLCCLPGMGCVASLG